MITKTSDTEMNSDVTRHTAQAAEGSTVTWLPGPALTRDQAVTAMTVAKMVIDGRPTTLGASGGHLSPLVTVAAPGRILASSGQGEPTVAMLAETGAELSAAGLAEALDGSERKLILARIASAEPAVVMSAAAWLARQRTEAAERRRKSDRRREHDRRRRRLAEGAQR